MRDLGCCNKYPRLEDVDTGGCSSKTSSKATRSALVPPARKPLAYKSSNVVPAKGTRTTSDGQSVSRKPSAKGKRSIHRPYVKKGVATPPPTTPTRTTPTRTEKENERLDVSLEAGLSTPGDIDRVCSLSPTTASHSITATKPATTSSHHATTSSSYHATTSSSSYAARSTEYDFNDLNSLSLEKLLTLTQTQASSCPSTARSDVSEASNSQESMSAWSSQDGGKKKKQPKRTRKVRTLYYIVYVHVMSIV